MTDFFKSKPSLIETFFEDIETLGSTREECIRNSIKVWCTVSSVLFPSTQNNDPVSLPANEVIDAHPHVLEALNWIKKSPSLKQHLLSQYQRHLSNRFQFKILPLINQKLTKENTSNSKAFCDVISLLFRNLTAVYSWLDVFEVPDETRNLFSSKVRSQCQSVLSPIFLKHAFSFFSSLTFYLDPPLSQEDYWLVICKLLSEEDGIELFTYLNPVPLTSSSKECIVIYHLLETGIFELLEPFILKISKQRIADFINTLDSSQRQLHLAFNWVHHLLFPTVAYCLHSMEKKTLYETLVNELFETIIQKSSDSIFDLILNQENMYDTIMDIKLCLKATNKYSLFVEHVNSQLKKRILQPGARTLDIILFFVDIIKLFRILDATGTLLHECTKELCDYLRTERKDTLRAMVQILFDPSRRLKNELAGDQIVFPRQEPVLKVTDQVDFSYCWEPAKFSRKSLKVSSTLPSADILSILVSIYQSKDAFIKEYQSNMSESLMKKMDFEIDCFIEDIEQLKARFGESSLNACDAMIRDVKESSRLNELVRSEFSEKSPVDALIISHLFWPSMDLSTSMFHPTIQSFLDKFSSFYKKARMSRHLQWLSTFGLVELEITLDDDEAPHEVTCTPLQASVILYFTTRPRWSEYLLAMRLALSGPTIQILLRFWCNLGFLRYSNATCEWEKLSSRQNPLIKNFNEMGAEYKPLASIEMNDDVEL